MSKISKLSDNSLNEVVTFLYRVKESLEGDFCHIEDNISKTFKKTLNHQYETAIQEQQRRYEEY